MSKKKTTDVLIRAAGILAGLAVAAVNAETAPDPATGDFWYLAGRSGYPGAAAVSVTTVTVATVPQVAGAPAFDSGVGEQCTVRYEREFLSSPCGICVLFR